MKERLTRKKEVRSAIGIRPVFEAITVGSGRSAEPYIIAFHYKSDNVAGKVLGTLFGFFEVEVHDEDAAYVVNFLASVAKKEYFANPRRSVEDGFETTLHKVNVALAEIAKEGNVSWLGHLHGILGAVDDREIFFSATGDGVLSLARDDTFRPISDGLADTIAEPHPLKTFTEVASGHLAEHDVFLALSPSVWTLFTPDELKKNIARMSAAEFGQFLRTALINELPIAGAVIIRIEAVSLPAPQPKKPSEAIPADASILANVWSRQAFEQARATRLAALKERESQPETRDQAPPREEQEEYVDRKTGHIYVQGEGEQTELGSETWQAKLALVLQSVSRISSLEKEKLRRALRRARKQGGFFLEEATVLGARVGRSVGRRWRGLLRRLREAQEKRRVTKEAAQEERVATLVAAESLMTPSVPPLARSRVSWDTLKARSRSMWAQCKEGWQTLLTHLPRPSLRGQRLTLSSIALPAPVPGKPSWVWLASLRERLASGLRTIASLLRTLAGRIASPSLALTRKRQFLILGAILLAIVGLGVYFLADRSLSPDEAAESSPAAETVPSEPAIVPATPEQDEPLATRLSDGRAVTAPYNGPVIALVRINDLAFGLTRDRLVNVATQESVALPEPIRAATAMDDLDALFLLGESGTLRMYTIANKQFEASTLPLPANAKADALGAYLTYLYVLDRADKILYRFPRSEGGFGAPTTWSKESLALRSDSPLVVGETIALIGEDNSVGLFERGKKTSASFGGTKTPVVPAALTFDKASTDLLVLDHASSRVVRYRVDGTLVAQYFHASFKDASALLMGPANTLLIVRPEGTFSFQLP